MPRIRTIKPETFDDPDLNALPMPARWLFVGLWTQADKAGRLEDEPRRLKTRLLPFDACDIDQLLALLSPRFIVRYSSNGRNYIQVNNFREHQRPHPKEAASIIPEPAVKLHGKPRKAGASKVDTGVLDTGSLILDTLSMPDKPGMEGFDDFWDAYPRKVGKGAARKVWAKMRATPALHARILEAIAQQRQCHQWTKDGGQFIPHPATWLSQARWDDEPDRPQSTRTVAQPLPTYDPDWCQHDPRCPSKDWHTIMCARESSHA